MNIGEVQKELDVQPLTLPEPIRETVPVEQEPVKPELVPVEK